MLCVSVTTVDERRVNTGGEREHWLHSSSAVHRFLCRQQGIFYSARRGFFFWGGGERFSASEALVLLKDTLQNEANDGSHVWTCWLTAPNHYGLQRTHAITLGDQQGSPALGYKLAITPVQVVLFGTASLFFFL